MWEHRLELFDEHFQAELAEAYADKPKGQPSAPSATSPPDLAAAGRRLAELYIERATCS